METAVIQNNDFLILKSQDDLMIGGYASIEIVDKQNDLITLKALEDAVKKYMENAKFRNVMTNHSNVQAGMSVVPTIEIQFVTGQSDAAAANLSSCPTTQAVRTPPPLQP